MAEETSKQSMNNLFDEDSDDSDEEMPDTQPAPPSTQESKTDNTTLFGSDSDDSDDEPAAGAGNANDDKDASNAEEKKANSDEDSDAEFADDGITGRKAPIRKVPEETQTFTGPPTHITVADMPLPQFKTNVSLHMAQLPRIVAIQPEAFSLDTYNSSVEDAEFKGGVHTMIRWTYKKDENGEFIRDANEKLVKESNAKIIKWSDGSYGLRVGDEIFDMDEFTYQLKNPNANKQGNKQKTDVPTCKDFLYVTQRAQAEEDGEAKPVGTVLECVASLESKFIPRPASLKSAAHKSFVLKERSRVIQRAQIQEFVTFVDPEKQKAERIRNKDDLMKQEKRSGGRGSSGGGKRKAGMRRNYMEDDDEHYDTVNIRSLKKRNKDDEDMDYGDDDDNDGDEDEWSKRKKRGFESGRKAARYNSEDEDDDEEEVIMDDDDDDEEEQVVNRKKATPAGAGQKRNAALFDDDDSD